MGSIKQLAFGAAVLACAGCTTFEGATTGPGYRSTLDDELMAAVEGQARHNGTEVHWINPPLKDKKKP